jgi:hypothetical protein
VVPIGQFGEDYFLCSCGEPIKHFERPTIGIATEIDYHCQSCKKTASDLANRSIYVEEQAETTFLRCARCIKSYEMNWRLVMSTQLMGESQLGALIIGMFLELTREAFQNSWAPMEKLLGVQQRAIGWMCCNLNLHKETMGKIGEMCNEGKVRYQIDVSYNMGWRKPKKLTIQYLVLD